MVYVHRDYMPRNLMVCEPNPGVLDFQDAVLGPITYDVVSLVRDAFISWDEERVLDWTRALLGEGEARRACRWRRTSASSGAPSSGWGCSATSRCSASSRASTTATASRSTSPTRRAFIGYARAASQALSRRSRRSLRLLDELA